MNAPVLLEGLFLHLVREGFPLGVRDLQEALRALEAGFGAGDRDRLMRMCQTLWARTEEENRRIHRLFRELLPRPTEAEIAAVTGQASPAPEPREARPGETQRETTRRSAATTAALEVAPVESARGVGVPKAIVSARFSESFILTPVPLVPLRACVIAWRRFRRALRTGPKVDLDVEQTIAEKARRGFLHEPVLVARRSNAARVVLLIDVSPSMTSWKYSTAALGEALAESHLREAPVYYFHGTPAVLFENETLSRRVPLNTALDRHPDCPAMIVSDAGSAKGAMDPRRIQETRDCVREFSRAWRPVVWLNPMPTARWRGTPAASIARFPGVAMAPFTSDGLIHAIDILRGRR